MTEHIDSELDEIVPKPAQWQYDDYVKAKARLLALIRQDRRELITRLRDDAKDELSHEKSYANNQYNITFYENVIKYLEGRSELQHLTGLEEADHE